jgi:streptogramin lyase
VWVADSFKGRISAYDPRTGRFREVRIPPGLSVPTAITTCAVGDCRGVWVTDLVGSRILHLP